MSISLRQALERAIVRSIAEDILKEGWCIFCEEDDNEKSLETPQEVWNETNKYDECCLVIKQGEELVGKIWLVFGNDGLDCIHDYTTGRLEFALKPTFDCIEQGQP